MATQDKILPQLFNGVPTKDSVGVLPVLPDHPNLLNVVLDDPSEVEWNGVPWKNVLSKWYEALSEQDSLQVMALLADHPSLLKVGWGDQASQFVWKEEPWEQRTALHVGVRRGNAELVRQVLVLCKVDVPEHSRKEEQDRQHLPCTSSTSGQLDGETEVAQKNGRDIAGGSQDDVTRVEGNRQPARSTSSASKVSGKSLKKSLARSDTLQAEKTGPTNPGPGFRKVLSSLSRSRRRGDDKSQEIAGRAVAKWTSQVEPSRIVTNDSMEKDRLVKDDSMAKNRLVKDDSMEKDDTFLSRLLLAKDGKYKIDAIAMGALHGNRKVFLLLLYAMRECKLHGVEKMVLPGLDVIEENEVDRDNRSKLREATEQFVQRFALEPTSYGASCVEKYNADLEFNFLPWQEYLFHFLVAAETCTPSPMECAKLLWTAIRSRADSTWRFLLKLQDGEGRTPITVVKHIYQFEEIFAKADEETDGECIIGSRDGAGRTRLQKLMALGYSDFLEKMLLWTGFPSVEGMNKVAPLLQEQWQHSIPQVVHAWTCKYEVHCHSGAFLGSVSSTNGFTDQAGLDSENREDGGDCRIDTVLSSPLHAAIIHGGSGWIWRSMYGLRHRSRGPPRKKPTTESGVQEALKLWEVLHKQATALWGATKSRFQRVKREEARQAPTRSIPEQSKLWEWCGHDVLYRWPRNLPAEGNVYVNLDAVELASLVGDVEDVQKLPLTAYNSMSKLNSARTDNKRTRNTRPWPALHIASNTASYDMLKLFLDDPLCDPYVEDWNGNTALHHALNVVTIGEFQDHLLDFVSCRHVEDYFRYRRGRKAANKKKTLKIGDEDPLVDRQGCINLLLEAGCDIFKTNKDGQPPFPQGDLSKNSKFRSWWYERQAREFDATQRTLSSASTAISVIATLVATASYVGPLQPPMGFSGDPPQIHDANLWVKIFIVCNTMSFYFAIIAVMLSLIPSIPMPQQRMTDELRRTQRMLALSLAVILPSVIFVLVAFVSSSIAIVSAGATSTGGSLAITTACLGGLLCLAAITIFFIRLLAHIFPRSDRVRDIYNLTNF